MFIRIYLIYSDREIDADKAVRIREDDSTANNSRDLYLNLACNTVIAGSFILKIRNSVKFEARRQSAFLFLSSSDHSSPNLLSIFIFGRSHFDEDFFTFHNFQNIKNPQ